MALPNSEKTAELALEALRKKLNMCAEDFEELGKRFADTAIALSAFEHPLKQNLEKAYADYRLVRLYDYFSGKKQIDVSQQITIDRDEITHLVKLIDCKPVFREQ